MAHVIAGREARLNDDHDDRVEHQHSMDGC
jgi:hypothetical protein